MSPEPPEGGRLPWRTILVALVLGSGIALLVLEHLASPLRVSGTSMRPTLEDGSVCLVLWNRGALREAGVGSIVLARLPAAHGGARVIKRVAAEEGRAPHRRFSLAGDNSARSRDSRVFGEVHESRILGVVVGRLAPRPSYWGVAGPAPPSALGRREALSPAGR